MKIIIGGSTSKYFHLLEFSKYLQKKDIETKVVVDTEIYAGFPSKNFSDWFDTGKKFNKLITEFKPDFILVDRQTNFAKKAIKEKIPTLVHLRGDFWTEIEMAKNTLYKYPPKRSILSIKEKIAFECFDKCSLILPICNYLERIVKSKYPEKNTAVMYQGIDPSKWFHEKGMNLKHPCVGILQGAVIWGKAQEMLNLKNVLVKMPNVTFYWAGDGPYRKKILDELNKYDNFVWLGPLEYPNKVRQFLSEIDVYALISGLDMSPLTLLEAQLMKKPVIATNTGGIPELMKDNETGFLVERESSTQLIEKLSIMLNDSKLTKIMGNNSRKYVEENFDWKIITKNFLENIKNISS